MNSPNRELLGPDGLPLGRRHFIGLLGAFGAATALGACGGPGGDDDDADDTTAPAGSAAPGSAPSGAGVTPAAQISFWSNHPGGSEDVTKEIIDAFHASQSDIKVELVTAGANYEEIAQKFQTALTGGGLPDLVVLSDVWWFRYYMQGTITPLDDLISQVGIDKADYVDSLVGDYLYEGQQWALPWARSTPLFYYNKDAWAAAGLEDRAPETWAEFAEWAPALMEANSDMLAFQHPHLAGYAGWSNQNVLWGYGGGWSAPDSFDITCDSPESIAAVEFLKDSVYGGKWAGVAATDAAADFSAGVATATVLSTGSLVGVLTNSPFEVGVGFLPGGPTTQEPVCPTGGAGVGIPADIPAENKLAAATFIKFLTEPENVIRFSEATGYMPIRKSADASAMIAETPQRGVAIEQLAVTRPQDYARVFLPGADIEMANSLANVLTANGDVASEMAALKAKLQTIYDNEVAPNI